MILRGIMGLEKEEVFQAFLNLPLSLFSLIPRRLFSCLCLWLCLVIWSGLHSWMLVLSGGFFVSRFVGDVACWRVL
jgi:hypothetical protein